MLTGELGKCLEKKKSAVQSCRRVFSKSPSAYLPHERPEYQLFRGCWVENVKSFQNASDLLSNFLIRGPWSGDPSLTGSYLPNLHGSTALALTVTHARQEKRCLQGCFLKRGRNQHTHRTIYFLRRPGTAGGGLPDL